MSAPTSKVRTAVYDRDGGRCVLCNVSDGLTFQHRRAVGAGGSKIRPGAADGLTLCYVCNAACEADMQMLALAYGWKVRRWADVTKVPCFFPHEWRWYRFEGLERVEVTAMLALDMLHATYGDDIFRFRLEAGV